MEWAKSPERREQLVLFAARLDDAVGPDHVVRLFDEILARLDWTAWEAAYDLRRGQPPIHPRVLAGVILYGLMNRIRASRALEEALQVRLDFRWLAEGRSIDHTTLSEFRRQHGEALQTTFVQIGLVARELGCLPLQTLAFDGTRLRASNRKSGTRTPAQLRELKRQLAETFAALAAQAQAVDERDEECLGRQSAHRLAEELADVEHRQRQVDAALAELQRAEQAGETIPKRLPITDPQSRVAPNKNGGYAPNYTPLAGVDADSGLIVTGDVIVGTDEEQYLVEAVEQVAEQFGSKPQAVLADGLFATGANLQALDEQQVTLYSPSGQPDPQTNPVLRDDLTQPVPADQYEQLPTKTVQGGSRRLDKAAFVYDPERDGYRCPQGRPLTRKQTTTDRRKDGTKVQRTRYQADAADCAVCPLRALCLSANATARQISRDQFEPHREALARRMATPEGQQAYAPRRAVGERPFAVIKQHFGVRQFLLRGLDRVRQEWRWLTIAFNLKTLLHVLQARPGPIPD